MSGGDEYPEADARDDVAFISQAIDKAVEAACIDLSRIYVMGFSGGGRMASRLACDLSDRIASIVAIGGIRFPRASDTELGLPRTVECSPERAVPVQAIHGHWDPINPWFGKALGVTPFRDATEEGRTIITDAPETGSSWSYSGEAALARWVEHNGCGRVPATSQLAEGVEKREYANCRDDAEVTLVFFKNLGHAVPGLRETLGPRTGQQPDRRIRARLGSLERR